MVRLMLVLGLVLSLAACGGSRTDGLSKSDEEALEARLEAAEAERAAAEADKVAAEADKAAAEADKAAAEADKAKAEADKAIAEAEVQHQLREAAAARQDAETARQEAETARQDAATARGEAETARQETETAEQARDRLAAEAETATREALQAEAIQALAGLGGTALAGDPEVTAKHNAPALVKGVNPAVTFANPSPSGSSAGRWYATRADNRGQDNEDIIVVYSDKGAPSPTPLTVEYPGRFNRVNTVAPIDNRREATIQTTDADVIRSSSSLFPTGGHTADVPLTVDTDNTPTTFEETVQISGTFHGASGHYWCVGSGANACTVNHTNRGYVLGGSGTWMFRTSSTNPMAIVDDAEFMYFGWWRRETTAGAFSYRTFHESMGATVSGNSDFNDLRDSASYEGPAIGQYAVPLGDQLNHGEFTATARFTANFETEMLSGSVSEFNVSPGWALTLKETPMSGGTVNTGDVSWTIDGNTRDGGNWDGVFHSEFDPYEGHVPDGLTGTFDAQHGPTGSPVARLQGAFGTHKQ